MKKIYLTEKEFTKLYLDSAKTIDELASYIGVPRGQVLSCAKKLGLSRRSGTKLIIQN